MNLTDWLPPTPEPDHLLEAFVGWAQDRGLELYPHQEEAALEIVTGSNAIVSTPTGSGKSLIAVAAHATALAQGVRSWYTAPLKALVSEKFFDLVDIFGARNVGMMTGDTAVNPLAPIMCCTAEILANLALRHGPEADVGQVVMDEFHFYADPQRGWAWQVPLLELTDAQFVLMSATLGEVSFFAEDLTRRTGRPTAVITSVERPVPLSYAFNDVRPLPDMLQELVQTGRAPVYVVHFTQAAAVERAGALLSVPLATRAERDAIGEEIGHFRFGKGFGQILSRMVRHGVGVHHAGMLPKYRRLVERLTQAGLLKVVCGTDTLGVGINVPIRTVLFTSLVKYDGVRSRHLSAREFHQIAGRAGRAGFDTEGEVVVQAPDHVIEYTKALARAGSDDRKRKRVVRRKAPPGEVSWTQGTFERLRDAAPEQLTSQFRVTHAMALQVLSRPGDPVAAMYELLTDNHEPVRPRNPLLRQAVGIYRSLKASGVVEHLAAPDAQGRRLRLTMEIPEDFALNQPLSPFALAALEMLDPQEPGHFLDVVSVYEAICEDPRQVLSAQQHAARGEAIGALKAEGYEYDERMAMIEDVTYPRPLAEELEAAMDIYRRAHPWVNDYELHPKSVVREMYERGETFTEFVARYNLARSEGVVLRYVSDVYKALRSSVPEEARTEELEDLVEWLGELVRGVDSSLLEEWEQLREGAEGPIERVPGVSGGEEPVAISANERSFKVLVRNAMFRRVELAAREAWEALGALDGGSGWDAEAWAAALEPYYEEYHDIGIGPEARAAALVTVRPGAGVWTVRQVLDDGADDLDWAITGEVDVAASDEAGAVVLRITDVGPMTRAWARADEEDRPGAQ